MERETDGQNGKLNPTGPDSASPLCAYCHHALPAIRPPKDQIPNPGLEDQARPCSLATRSILWTAAGGGATE